MDCIGYFMNSICSPFFIRLFKSHLGLLTQQPLISIDFFHWPVLLRFQFFKVLIHSILSFFFRTSLWSFCLFIIGLYFVACSIIFPDHHACPAQSSLLSFNTLLTVAYHIFFLIIIFGSIDSSLYHLTKTG